MKKFLLFIIFLLNLLPNMNIRTGSISIGWSTLSAQQMGNEHGYHCYDDEIGGYYSPLPCDEEVCHQACIIGDCPWEGPCDYYDFHVQVDHSDTDDHQDNNNQDNSNDSSNNGGYGGGGGGNGGSSSGSGGHSSGSNNNFHSPSGAGKEAALKMVDDFRNAPRKTVFPGLPKDQYAARLEELINNPTLVKQGNNGVCGAAVLAKFLLENDPALFAYIAINLYQTGRCEFVSGSFLYLPQFIFYGNGTDTDLINIDTNSVDALVLGGITNWANYVLDFDPFSGKQSPRSLMLPNRIEEFVKLLGYNVVVKGNTLVPTVASQLTFDEIRSFNIDYNNNFVIGLIATENAYCGIADHYIQILNIDFNLLKLDYWSWGGNYKMNDNEKVIAIIIINKK